MNFLNNPHPAGRKMTVDSVARSLLPPEGMEMLVHDGPAGTTCTWWGVLMSVGPGDRVHYFQSPSGICIEWVEPAAVEATLGTVA